MMPPTHEERRTRDPVGRWSHEGLVRYGEELRASGEKLTQAAIYKRYLLHWGPSPALIKDNFGTLYEYYEHLGLVGNIEKWENADYIDWYRQLVGAGVKEEWTARDIARLSKSLLAPSVDMLIDNFGGLTAFRSVALDRPLAGSEIMLAKIKHRVHELKIEHDGQQKLLVYSENLQMLSVDRHRVQALDARSNTLLALLFRNAGSPVFAEDFFEKTGQEDSESLTKAWDEISSIEELSPFIIRYKPGRKPVFGLVFDEEERELFASRLAYTDIYPAAEGNAEKFLNKRNAILAGIGVVSLTGTAIIGYMYYKGKQ